MKIFSFCLTLQMSDRSLHYLTVISFCFICAFGTQELLDYINSISIIIIIIIAPC